MSVLQAAVRLIIEDLMDHDTSFTAWDITRIIRGEAAEEVPHEDVRAAVHALYDEEFMEGYLRVEVKYGDKTAFKYFPCEEEDDEVNDDCCGDIPKDACKPDQTVINHARLKEDVEEQIDKYTVIANQLLKGFLKKLMS